MKWYCCLRINNMGSISPALFDDCNIIEFNLICRGEFTLLVKKINSLL